MYLGVDTTGLNSIASTVNVYSLTIVVVVVKLRPPKIQGGMIAFESQGAVTVIVIGVPRGPSDTSAALSDTLLLITFLSVIISLHRSIASALVPS